MKPRKHLPRQTSDNRNKYDARIARRRSHRSFALHNKMTDLTCSHGVFSTAWRRIARRYYRTELMFHAGDKKRAIPEVAKTLRRLSRI